MLTFLFFILTLGGFVWNENRGSGFVEGQQVDTSSSGSLGVSLSEPESESDKELPSLLESLFLMEEIEGEIEKVEKESLFFEPERDQDLFQHPPKELRWQFYKVQKGDTLSSISRRYQVHVDTLKSFNSIDSSNSWINSGDILEIPSMEGILHTVRKGETLNTLLQTYQKDSSQTLNEKELRQLNRMSENDEIQRGEHIFIPGARLKAKSIPKRLKTKERQAKKNLQKPQKENVFLRPVKGIVSSPVGFRIHPVKKYRHFHRGLDIRASRGTLVRATEKGRILFSGWSGGYGNLIILGHEKNWKSYYAHLSKILLEKGTQVKKGQIIGEVGNTGLTTGTHLHFELRKDGKPLRVLSVPGLEGKLGNRW